jgi:SpoVK/Ycf46/Vps4 family AAA+-type ATPase
LELNYLFILYKLLKAAAAFEAKATLFSIKPSSLLSKYQGESERALQRIFQQARKCDKAVIFFDEFDCIATARGQSDEGCGQSRRLLSELLLQLTLQKQHQKVRKQSNGCSINLSKIYDGKCDGDEQEQGTVVVIAATNR